LYGRIEFLRQNRSGVTDSTGDRTDSKRQDGQQETGRTARDRTDSKRQDGQHETGRTARDRTGSKVDTGQGLKVRLSKMGEQDNTIMAGEGGLLSKIETGNANKSGGTGQEGQTERRG
jgi:hypothetical protein